VSKTQSTRGRAVRVPILLLLFFSNIQKFANDKKRIDYKNYCNKNYQRSIVAFALNSAENKVWNYQNKDGKAEQKNNLQCSHSIFS